MRLIFLGPPETARPRGAFLRRLLLPGQRGWIRRTLSVSTVPPRVVRTGSRCALLLLGSPVGAALCLTFTFGVTHPRFVCFDGFFAAVSCTPCGFSSAHLLTSGAVGFACPFTLPGEIGRAHV